METTKQTETRRRNAVEREWAENFSDFGYLIREQSTLIAQAIARSDAKAGMVLVPTEKMGKPNYGSKRAGNRPIRFSNAPNATAPAKPDAVMVIRHHNRGIKTMGDKWRPISEAPRDGREFLACYTRQGNVMQIARWSRVYLCWQVKGEWQPGFEANATHWMPLPDPPEEK